MKKILLPTLIVAMGFGGAYAGSKASKAMPTYRIEGSQCIQVEQECDEQGDVVCTWNDDGINQLYKFQSPDETTCSSALHRSL
ncbi:MULTISPECIES: DUF6520 family protein [Bacteroidota]|uniref:Uncharacterized protein n=2 Tax=Bacteroidota TaxID=976 RepID=A0A2X2LQ01_SPHMU|nr:MULTISPECIES: DUF6520 family protein [Bacteroidota]AZB25141.1 hypothetical protein EG339_11400 [Chryseobacterium bernardetii]QRQ63229.1 hypothetical protein I6J33_09785 [Sphingobacterium multivorum]SPZ95069.1 Uncharacterised protein [Sphingobacterium multivorum]